MSPYQVGEELYSCPLLCSQKVFVFRFQTTGVFLWQGNDQAEAGGHDSCLQAPGL